MLAVARQIIGALALDLDGGVLWRDLFDQPGEARQQLANRLRRRPDIARMGDAAFGMTGLDFETAVRCSIPITTVVFNNSAMAIERHALVVSHERYRTRDIGGHYADMGRAMGGYAERVENPDEIAAALQRARRANEDGKAVLLEFITSEEIAFSHRRAL